MRVLHHVRAWETDSGDKADDRSGNTGWCGLPQHGGLACHELAEGPYDCTPAPSAYREGDTDGQMGQGARPATSAHPRVFRQSAGGETGDGKPRETDRGCGSDHLGHARAKRHVRSDFAAAWL